MGTLADRKINPYCTTASGRRVTFLNPKPNQIAFSDIALSLANTIRYQGGLYIHYSNAEHSILGTKYASTFKVQREFLVHDFAEYIFADVPAPVKWVCPEYCALEETFQRFLNKHFLGYEELSPEVKEIDSRITCSEMKVIRGASPEDLYATPYSNFKPHMWNSFDALNNLVKLFKEYFPSYNHSN